MLAASPKPPPVTAPDAAATNGLAPMSTADPGSTIAAIKQQLAAARANHTESVDPGTPKDATPTGDDAQHPARTAGARRRRRSTAPAAGVPAGDAWRDQLQQESTTNNESQPTTPPTPSSQRRASVEASTQAPVDAAGATAEDHVRRYGKAELESMRFAAGSGWRLPITIFPGTLQVPVPAPPSGGGNGTESDTSTQPGSPMGAATATALLPPHLQQRAQEQAAQQAQKQAVPAPSTRTVKVMFANGVPIHVVTKRQRSATAAPTTTLSAHPQYNALNQSWRTHLGSAESGESSGQPRRRAPSPNLSGLGTPGSAEMDVAMLLPPELLRDQFSAPGADPWTPPQAVRDAAAAAADTPWMPTTSRPAAPYFASALLPKNPSITSARMPVGATGTGSAADANLMAMMMSMDPAFMERMAGMYIDADHGRPHVDPNAAMHRQQTAPRSRTFTAPVGLGLGGSAAIPIRAPPAAGGSGNASSRVSFAGGRAGQQQGQQQPAPIERPAPMRQPPGGTRPREDSGTASMFTGRSALMGSTMGGAANAFDPSSAGRRAGGQTSTAPSAHGSRTSSMYGQVSDLYSDPYAAQYAFQQPQQGAGAWSGRSSRTTSYAAPPPPPPAAVQDPHARHRTGTGPNYSPAEMAAAFAAQYGMPAMDASGDYEALARMTQLPRSRMPSVPMPPAGTQTAAGMPSKGPYVGAGLNMRVYGTPASAAAASAAASGGGSNGKAKYGDRDTVTPSPAMAAAIQAQAQAQVMAQAQAYASRGSTSGRGSARRPPSSIATGPSPTQRMPGGSAGTSTGTPTPTTPTHPAGAGFMQAAGHEYMQPHQQRFGYAQDQYAEAMQAAYGYPAYGMYGTAAGMYGNGGFDQEPLVSAGPGMYAHGRGTMPMQAGGGSDLPDLKKVIEGYLRDGDDGGLDAYLTWVTAMPNPAAIKAFLKSVITVGIKLKARDQLVPCLYYGLRGEFYNVQTIMETLSLLDLGILDMINGVTVDTVAYIVASMLRDGIVSPEEVEWLVAHYRAADEEAEVLSRLVGAMVTHLWDLSGAAPEFYAAMATLPLDKMFGVENKESVAFELAKYLDPVIVQKVL